MYKHHKNGDNVLNRYDTVQLKFPIKTTIYFLYLYISCSSLTVLMGSMGIATFCFLFLFQFQKKERKGEEGHFPLPCSIHSSMHLQSDIKKIPLLHISICKVCFPSATVIIYSKPRKQRIIIITWLQSLAFKAVKEGFSFYRYAFLPFSRALSLAQSAFWSCAVPLVSSLHSFAWPSPNYKTTSPWLSTLNLAFKKQVS